MRVPVKRSAAAHFFDPNPRSIRNVAAPPLPPKVRWANFYYTRLQYLIAVIVTCCFYVVLGLSSWDMGLTLSAAECKESREAVDFLYVLAMCSTLVIILCKGKPLAMKISMVPR
jgi:hypothetical protein